MSQLEAPPKRKTPVLGVVVMVLCLLTILLPLAGKAAWQLVQKLGAIPLTNSQLAELEAARALWEARPFTGYSLTIERIFADEICQLIVEVEYEVVTGTSENACSIPMHPWTVVDIFDAIESTILERQCGPNGCECDGVVVPVVEYHPRLGYPLHIQYDLHQDWTTQADPFRFIQTCTLMGMVTPEFAVTLIPGE